MPRRYQDSLICFLLVCLGLAPGVFPWVQWHLDSRPDWLLLATLNLLAWWLVARHWLERRRLQLRLLQASTELGMTFRKGDFQTALQRFLTELARKNTSISIDLMAGEIKGRQELSRALERVVSTAYRLLDAKSAELALFDLESGMYHSSLVIGRPMHKSSQAMLSGAVEGDESLPTRDVLVQPIVFAGTQLGSLRVALKERRSPSKLDQEIVRILAIESGVAILNAHYSEELLRMRRVSEESVRAKTGFLANLSHELRGPLGIMLNAVQLLREGLCGQVNAEQLEVLEMVDSSGKHLLELVNDVLDYAKIEAGKLTTTPEAISLSEILTELREVVRRQAESKGHTFTLREVSKDLAARCDRRHFRQMCINLLTNAVKYTPKGGRIELLAERLPGERLRVAVKDSGVGIAMEDQGKIFSAFERIEHVYSTKQEGSGLGLALTRKLAEINGGTVEFRSEFGRGSEFWIVLPAAGQSEERPEQAQAHEQDAQGLGSKILLLEGDPSERRLVERYLKHLGFELITVSSEKEALAEIRAAEPDLVIVGNESIDSDAAMIVSGLRRESPNRRLPIIVVSSRSFVFDVEKYLRAGIDLCLAKPLALKKLGASCRTLIDQSRGKL